MRQFVLLVVACAVPAMAGTVTRTVAFSASDLVFSQADGGDVVDLAGYPALIVPGSPRVPRVVEAVSIPAGAEPTGVELVAVDWQTVDGRYRLAPAQPDQPLPMPGRVHVPRLYPPDPAVYSASEAYPKEAVRRLEFGTLGGYRMAYAELRPVRWNPATGELQVATRLTYRLSYQQQGRDNLVPTERLQTLYGRMVRSLVANPRSVAANAPKVGKKSVTALPPGEYDYVVISEPPLDTVFARLAQWKTLKGVPATVVTKSWIDANYTGYDLPDKLRNFIIDAYQTWGTHYVLMGGAADHKTSGQNIIPGRDAWYIRQGLGYYPDEDTIPCDLYFGGLDGTWDYNNNHVYGERADRADMVSEVFVGRASVNNIAQAQNFVAKTLTYEQSPPAGYLRRMLLPTAILWSSYEERQLQESLARMTPVGWQDSRLYERTGTLSRQAMRDSMNSGFGLGNWVGHGNENGIYMGSSPYLNSSDADALTNGARQGVHASIACFTGAWDEVPGGDCFAEHLMNRAGGGTVGMAMNSRYGYGAYAGGYVPGPSERLDTVFFSRIVNHGEYRAGQALAFSRAFWSPYADSGGRYDMQRFCIYELNLFGDPELSVWSTEPVALSAAHSGVVALGNNVPYHVTVTDPSTAPVESALVLLWKGSELYTRTYTNSSGQVTVLVSTQTPGPMLLSVNVRNHYVLVDTVQVIASQRYVTHLRSWVFDPGPGGNNDSILNPGETVRLPTWVKNWGQQTANSVTAVLRTHDPHARITDSTKTFGNIPAGDSAYTGTDGFGLEVDDGLENGYSIACSLVCRDALDSAWVSNMVYRVGTPVLVHGPVAFRDSARGNGNGRLDPGEASDLAIAVRNSGLGHAANCRGRLSSGDTLVWVIDPDADFGVIRAGDTVTNYGDMFAVRAAASIPIETRISCTLRLVADGGYSVTLPLTIMVGEIRQPDPIPDGPRLPSRYYAYDNVDTAYEHHPTYNWFEIKTLGTQLTYPHNDDVLVLNLPGEFGPLRFYGSNYTQVSVSADGWLCPGSYTTRHYANTGLPDASAPPGMVCMNWDDLYPGYGSQGFVYHYHDAANHRFVIEYDSVAYYNPNNVREKFQVFIYDTTVTTHTGDNLIVVQYKTANRYESSTIGIQDPTRTIGIQALCDMDYHRGCAPIAPGRAVAYRTDPPTNVGTSEPARALNLAGRQLAVAPNPARNRAMVAWHVTQSGRVSVAVYDAAGRCVRNLARATMEPGRYRAEWDSRTESGRRVADGVYFVRLTTESASVRHKLILTR
ncbi:T9SS type A sorting domain-containing protein [candidate division WOR-3 bacterium]|nr:T9SS type A sorting domain-containing protein [candidate division WOR-3 bacterium]